VLGVGLALFVLSCLFSVGLSIWTFIMRKKSPIVRASQPEFLQLICLGTLMIALSILPMMVQGEYRYEQDPLTKQLFEDEPNDAMGSVDNACMAFWWLFGLGFILVYSALFAKIWRTKLVFYYAERCQRRQVGIKDVGYIMVVLLAIELIILLSWQFIDPLEWVRMVVSTDAEGFPLQSVGRCESKNQQIFTITLLAYKGICLVYALYLCYVTRNMPSDFSEGKWVMASIVSIIQILILAIPILIIVENDNNSFYFIRAATMFLISCTVSSLIFGPKVKKHYFPAEGDSPGSIRMPRRSSITSDVQSAQDLGKRPSE